jgi:hypothetical protein
MMVSRFLGRAGLQACLQVIKLPDKRNKGIPLPECPVLEVRYTKP